LGGGEVRDGGGGRTYPAGDVAEHVALCPGVDAGLVRGPGADGRAGQEGRVRGLSGRKLDRGHDERLGGVVRAMGAGRETEMTRAPHFVYR
jgi:hypothetical protein